MTPWPTAALTMSQRDMNPIRPFITTPPEPRRWRIRDVVADTLVCGGIIAMPFVFIIIFGGQP